MVQSRSLPKEFNPLLTEAPPAVAELSERRRLGQTILAVSAIKVGAVNATKPENLGRFDYAHLRAPLPKNLQGSDIFKAASPNQPPPESYFLMRRSSDGYVSATGMFKATFPWASSAEEEAERRHIRGLSTTSPEETAGNVWIPPIAALELADEYRVVPWIQALLDPQPIRPAESHKQSNPISTPPKFTLPKGSSFTSASSTPISRKKARARRSASPTKNASPAKKGISARKQLATKAASAANAQAASASLQAALDGAASTADSEEQSTDGGDKVKVEVKQTIDVNGDVETEHTTVKVEMPANSPKFPIPESTEEMIAKAKEMVDQAVKLEGSEAKKSKRKADTVGDAEDLAEAQKTKKTKLTEEHIKKQKVRTRALIGVTATLALGAAIPYFL
ncbi:MAG: hypothetical protein M1814_005132 [Vezdaea aestivalis]|nr:MAG: hypothetical protein M1814_005132 [Vezdaea aestivalis]